MSRHWVVRVEWRLARPPEESQQEQIHWILGNFGVIGGHLWTLLRTDAETEAGAIGEAVACVARLSTEVVPPVELDGRVWAEIDGAEDDG